MARTRIINQPIMGSLGDELISLAADERFSEMVFMTAFAKHGGVSRLENIMAGIRSRGGKVSAFVGIDLDVTTSDALRWLLGHVDELYVVHTSNGIVFHPKTYVFHGKEAAWIAVGSNNATTAGLWSNFECASVTEYDLNDPDDAKSFSDEIEYIEALKTMNSFVKRIESERDLERIIDEYNIRDELPGVLASQGKPRKYRKDAPSTFGPGPRKNPPPLAGRKAGSRDGGQEEVVYRGSTEAGHDSLAIPEADQAIWFVTQSLTGGSRNILDLSKTGRISGGSPSGTVLDMGKTDTMLGGVAFFGIDPFSDDAEARWEFTVEYRGAAYQGNYIEYTPGNGSWRMHINGASADGEKLHKVGGQDWLVKKILSFKRIDDNRYAMFVSDMEALPSFIESSVTWGTNGTRADARAYGLLGGDGREY